MVQLVDLDNMAASPYLCVFHLATAGQQGPNLGSDEEEIVAMIYIVIDKALHKVVGIQQYLVKPNVANTNDSFLSPEVLLETSITEDLVRNSLPLEYVILQFDNYVRSLQIGPHQMQFVTDGELPLRQCLHPEACNKNIELPEYYNSFIDLRKDFKAFYSSPDDMGSVREMIECIFSELMNESGGMTQLRGFHVPPCRPHEKGDSSFLRESDAALLTREFKFTTWNLEPGVKVPPGGSTCHAGRPLRGGCDPEKFHPPCKRGPTDRDKL